MADLKKMILDELRKSQGVQTETINEMEEYIDTGLEKTEENITEVALNYLDEKGYRRRADNLEYAKQMILNCSEDYDTIIIRRKQVVEEDLFEDASMEELRDALNLCILNNLNTIQEMFDYMLDIQYEYKVEVVSRLFSEADRPKGHLTSDNFETFEEMLNRYAGMGYQLDRIIEPRANVSPVQYHIIFRREKTE